MPIYAKSDTHRSSYYKKLYMLTEVFGKWRKAENENEIIHFLTIQINTFPVICVFIPNKDPSIDCSEPFFGPLTTLCESI